MKRADVTFYGDAEGGSSIAGSISEPSRAERTHTSPYALFLSLSAALKPRWQRQAPGRAGTAILLNRYSFAVSKVWCEIRMHAGNVHDQARVVGQDRGE